jgi:hypothetical protein
MEEGSSELTIGNAVQTNPFLPFDSLSNGLIFGCPQFCCGNFPSLKTTAGIEQFSRPEQAADMIGSIRWG